MAESMLHTRLQTGAGQLAVDSLAALTDAHAVPGLYLEESAQATLSINAGATAIPVFIGRFHELDGSLASSDTCIAIASYVHFQRRFSTAVRATISLDSTPRVSTDNALGAFAVRHYFDNGGGRCYVLPVPDYEDDDALRALPARIARYAEISLYCYTERDGAEAVVYAALEPLLQETGGGLLIADSADGVTRPTTTAQRTAVYHPGVVTPYEVLPADDQVSLPPEDDLPARTLADLRSTEPQRYRELRRAVDEWFRLNYPAVVLNASAAVAGVYCQVDRSKGVWAAPAGVLLNNVSRLHNPGSASVQMRLMANRINALKDFAEEGVRVWGARTMVDPLSSPWLNVAVSRLFDAAARDLRQALRFAVFLPNNETTWSAVRSALRSYLQRLWREGGLHGATSDEAFYVQVGAGLSMTAAQIDSGLLVVRVGLAPVRALEFIEIVFTEQLTSALASVDPS